MTMLSMTKQKNRCLKLSHYGMFYYPEIVQGIANETNGVMLATGNHFKGML